MKVDLDNIDFSSLPREYFDVVRELLAERQRLDSLVDVPKLEANFEAKSEYVLQNDCYDFVELTLVEFVEKLFQRDEWVDVDVPFEERMSLEYKIWDKQRKEMIARVGQGQSWAMDYSGYRMWRYNPVVFYKEGKRNLHRLVLKDQGESFAFLEGRKFAIMPPATFVGNTNSYKNARFLYAFAIDLDGVDVGDLNYLLHGMTTGFYPTANIVVNSGHGVHLYYLLAQPIGMFSTRIEALNKLKAGLTKLVWTVSKFGVEKAQVQSVVQGFRLPGTLTKFGKPIRAFFNQGAPMHAIEDLNRTVNKKYKLTDIEISRLNDDKPYNPASVTLEEAQRLWPEWYAARVIGKKRVGKKWHINRALYDWWLDILKDGTQVEEHHRYWCILTLVVYAVKCDIPRDEVLQDALGLVRVFDAKSTTVDNPFIEDDVYDAMRAYDEEYNKWPLRVIETTTGIRIEKNKRNGRTQRKHIQVMNAIRDNVTHPDGEWRKGNGRKKGSRKSESDSRCAAIVRKWKEEHPASSNKSQCARETGLSRPTVLKWWNKEKYK